MATDEFTPEELNALQDAGIDADKYDYDDAMYQLDGDGTATIGGTYGPDDDDPA
jgi:GH25 family lysozyme M1 (1,4-beta-N-acetylmuramidase)